jgi:hypothetical protein
MVHQISNVIKEYQDKLREMPYVPKTSYQRDSLGYSGDANKTFLTFLFSNRDIGIQFLQDAGFIRSKVQYNSGGRDMTWYAEPNILRPTPRDFQLLISRTLRYLTTQVCAGSQPSELLLQCFPFRL